MVFPPNLSSAVIAGILFPLQKRSSIPFSKIHFPFCCAHVSICFLFSNEVQTLIGIWFEETVNNAWQSSQSANFSTSRPSDRTGIKLVRILWKAKTSGTRLGEGFSNTIVSLGLKRTELSRLRLCTVPVVITTFSASASIPRFCSNVSAMASRSCTEPCGFE